MKLLRLPVSENKNSEVDLVCSYVVTCDPWGGPVLITGASSFREEEFLNPPFVPIFQFLTPGSGANLDPRRII